MKYSCIQVGPEYERERLDVFLARKFDRSRTAVRTRLAGDVLSGAGKQLKWSHRLRAGEVIRVATRVHPEPQVEVTYRILHQDDWILAVDKGPGAPVHPARSFRTRTVLTRLREDLKEPDLKPAHRLDRETSGVLVFARDPKTLSAMMDRFKQGLVRKKYLAVVRGEPDFDHKTLELSLGRDPDFPIRCRIRPSSDGGRPAVTEFSVIKRHPDRALVAAFPRTGRQHQIRVHLAALGHPLLGDKLYQEDGTPYLAMIRNALDEETVQRLGHHRQALHAESLEFEHPETGKKLSIRAELPGDLKSLLG